MAPVKHESVASFLDQFKDKHLTPPKGNGPMAMGAVWNQACLDEGYSSTSFTLKGLGQIKHLMAKTPGKTALVIQTVVKNWVSFAKGVANDAGLKQFPYLPSYGFVLTHVNLASEFTDKILNPLKLKDLQHSTPMQSIASSGSGHTVYEQLKMAKAKKAQGG